MKTTIELTRDQVCTIAALYTMAGGGVALIAEPNIRGKYETRGQMAVVTLRPWQHRIVLLALTLARLTNQKDSSK